MARIPVTIATALSIMALRKEILRCYADPRADTAKLKRMLGHRRRLLLVPYLGGRGGKGKFRRFGWTGGRRGLEFHMYTWVGDIPPQYKDAGVCFHSIQEIVPIVASAHARFPQYPAVIVIDPGTEHELCVEPVGKGWILHPLQQAVPPAPPPVPKSRFTPRSRA